MLKDRLFAVSTRGRVASAHCPPEVGAPYGLLPMSVIDEWIGEWEQGIPVTEEDRSEEGVRAWWEAIEHRVVRRTSGLVEGC